MESKGADSAQIKNLLINNRHNHITAHYYLLRNKIEKNALFAKEFQERLRNSRKSDSPLIYRPENRKPVVN